MKDRRYSAAHLSSPLYAIKLCSAEKNIKKNIVFVQFQSSLDHFAKRSFTLIMFHFYSHTQWAVRV